VSGPALWPGVVARYRALLPVGAETPAVTLHEGNTPLLEAPRLAEVAGGDVRVFLKCEGLNPTGSVTDRGMAVAVARALEAGARAVVCISAGDTAASAAAYAARAGLRAVVVVPRVGVAMGHLAQAALHGAIIVLVDGSLEQTVALVQALVAARPVILVDQGNADRMAGLRSVAFEVVDQLGRAPDLHLVPGRSAALVVAHWEGYRAYQAAGYVSNRPRVVACPPADVAHPATPDPPRAGSPARPGGRRGDPTAWPAAQAAVRASGGWVEAVSDEGCREAYRLLARVEGVFVEPAAAAPVSGLLRAAKAGRLPGGASCVLTLAGHGLRDHEAALESTGRPVTIPPRIEALARVIGL
jgi:threonine synthase